MGPFWPSYEVGMMVRRPETLKKFAIWMSLALFFSIVPLLFREYYVHLLTKVLIMGLLALSFGLLLGYAGMLSFGQSAYYGIGAYACSLYLKKLSSTSFLLPVSVGVLISAFAALVIGFFCVKLTKVYFALLTLAFSQLIYAIIFKWYSFTGGDNS